MKGEGDMQKRDRIIVGADVVLGLVILGLGIDLVFGWYWPGAAIVAVGCLGVLWWLYSEKRLPKVGCKKKEVS